MNLLNIKKKLASRRFQKLCEQLYYTEALKKAGDSNKVDKLNIDDPVVQKLDQILAFFTKHTRLYTQRFNVKPEDYLLMVNSSYMRASRRLL
ncbi:MAG: hypothetical protein OCD76_10545 [Reichenbachiella sp.]